MGEIQTGTDIIFNPSSPLFQKCQKHGCSRFITPMIEQLPGVVKLMSGIRDPSMFFHGLIDLQIAVGIRGVQLSVADGRPAIKDGPGRCDYLVYRSLPEKSPASLQKALPVIRHGGVPLLVEGHLIRHHDDIRAPIQLLFHLLKFLPVLIFDHVIRIQPHLIIHSCF